MGRHGGRSRQLTGHTIIHTQEGVREKRVVNSGGAAGAPKQALKDVLPLARLQPPKGSLKTPNGTANWGNQVFKHTGPWREISHSNHSSFLSLFSLLPPSFCFLPAFFFSLFTPSPPSPFVFDAGSLYVVQAGWP